MTKWINPNPRSLGGRETNVQDPIDSNRARASLGAFRPWRPKRRPAAGPGKSSEPGYQKILAFADRARP